MPSVRSASLAMLVGLSLASTGCNDEPALGTPRAAPSAPATDTSDAPAHRIAEALCQRERRCGTAGGPGTSIEPCVARRLAADDGGFVLDACSGTIDEGHLTECLFQIQLHDCKLALDTLEQVEACGAAVVCEER